MENFIELILQDDLLREIFTKCPEEIKNRLVMKRVPANYVVIEKDDIVDSVFILIKGRFDVFKKDDKCNALAYLSNRSPSFAGILELLSEGKIANATVRTSQESMIVIANGVDFKAWIESDFEIYKLVLTNFTKDMYHSLNYIDSVIQPHGKNLLMKYISANYRDEIMNNGSTTICINKEILCSRLNMKIENLEENISILLQDNLLSITSNEMFITEQQLGRIEGFLLHNNPRM